jgi:ribosomal-protein-alanine N-acetyltransferase
VTTENHPEPAALSGIHFRSFAHADLPSLYDLDQVCFPPEIAYSLGELRFFLNKRGSFCLVAQRADSVIGFMVTEITRRRDATAGHIITLDIAPGMRRRGIAGRLLSLTEERLREEGASSAMLEVAEDNSAARAFYRQSGFADVGRIPRYYAGRIDARVMKKSISG